MLSLRISKILPLSLLAAGLMAQSGSVRGPVAGFVFDGAERAVRPMIGIPGASYLGAPVLSDVDFASVSPDGARALAVSGGRLQLVEAFHSEETRSSSLGSLAIDRAAWSDDSGVAVIYSGATGRLYRYSVEGGVSSRGAAAGAGSGSRAARGRVASSPRLSVLGKAPGKVTALAVDERGDAVAGVEDEVAGGLYLFAQTAAAKLITRIGSPSGVVAGPGGKLYVTDRARSEVLEISGYRESADVRLFAGAGRGISEPAGVGLSADGRSLLVANAGDRRLAVFDIATCAETARLDLEFEPTRLKAMAGGSLYVLNARREAGDTLQVFRAGPSPRVYFVPAATAPAASETSPVEE